MAFTEIGLLCFTVTALTGYHLAVARRITRMPEKTAIGCSSRMRERWVASIMAEKKDILAVQTMRNWIIAATFLASTSILISLGLLGAALKPSAIEDISHAMNLVGTINETLWMATGTVILILVLSRVDRAL